MQENHSFYYPELLLSHSRVISTTNHLSVAMQYRQSWAPGADWQNFENHTDVVDPQRHEAKLEREAAAAEVERVTRFERRFQAAAQRPPKFISTDEAISRRVGFIIMNYG